MPLKKIAETLEQAYRQGESQPGRKRPTRATVRRLRKLFFQVLFPEIYCEQGLRGRLRDRTRRRLRILQIRLLDALKRLQGLERDRQGLLALANDLLGKLPEIRRVLLTDVEAAMVNDPAAKDRDEVLLSYPFVEALATHRVAHELYRAGVPTLPRMLSELAHRDTGIDIHPGATIGEYFFIDHGTGVVIGETAEIGERVTLYQGVTLGAKNPKNSEQNDQRGKKRHPTLQNGVTVYAGATILGGDTVIGEGGVVGGNVWLTTSLPPGAKVLATTPDNRIIPGDGNKLI